MLLYKHKYFLCKICHLITLLSQNILNTTVYKTSKNTSVCNIWYMFLVNKIMYVKYTTENSKLLNGSVHFKTRLSESLLPTHMYWVSCRCPEMGESARIVHVIS